MVLKIVLPSETGTTIKAELKMSRVIQATTSKRTMRRAKLYLLKGYGNKLQRKKGSQKSLESKQNQVQ